MQSTTALSINNIFSKLQFGAALVLRMKFMFILIIDYCFRVFDD